MEMRNEEERGKELLLCGAAHTDHRIKDAGWFHPS